MLAVLLVAVSLGLSNFAASVGIGVSGVDGRTRLRVGVIFGVFETAMPIIGLLAGRGLARTLGHGAHWIGAALLIATGAYALIQAIRADGRPDDTHASAASAADKDSPDRAARPAGQQTWRLIITGAALSVDNLAVGFALGTYHISFGLAAIVIGAVSVTMSLIGLELGHRLGTRAGGRGELIGGLVLVGVGIAIAAGVL
jgi:putative Mn2+ efflux pump MntP